MSKQNLAQKFPALPSNHILAAPYSRNSSSGTDTAFTTLLSKLGKLGQQCCSWSMQATMSSGKFILYEPDNDWSNKSVSEANSSVGALTGRSIQQRDHDYAGQLLRYVAEVWLSLPIAVFGIIGNIVAFIVLCHQRRHKLQIITVLLQVPATLSKSILHVLVRER